MRYNGTARLFRRNGFSFDFEILYGLEIFGDGVKAGVQSSLETVSGTSTTESTGRGISCGGTVQSISEKEMKANGYTDKQIRAYSFSWRLGLWDSNVPTGKTDDAGNTLYVPVVGYVLSNVTSPTRPVSEVEIEVRYDSARNPQGVNVSWDDPSATAKGYPKPTGYTVYIVEGDTYTKVGSTPAGTTEFFYADLQGRSTLCFAVRSIYGSGSSAIESIDGRPGYCYIVYVGATGATGAKGDRGPKGDPGVGIANISLTSRNGNIDTYTITLTDGSTYDFTVTNAPAATGERVVIYANDIEEGDYIIYSAVDNGMCLDIDGSKGARNSGDLLHIWSADTAAYKVFTLTKDMNTGSYIIKAKHSGLVLDVAGASKANGASITQYGNNDTMAQRWVFEPASNGYFYIRCIGGQYMDVAGMTGNAVPVDGTIVHSWGFTGAKNQQFRLVKVPSNFTASVLSEGDLWIVIALVVLAGGGIAALVIYKKKTAK